MYPILFRRHTKRRSRLPLIGIVLLFASTPVSNPAAAQSYDLKAFVLGRGATEASGSTLSLWGTAGQLAQGASAADGYSIGVGFWYRVTGLAGLRDPVAVAEAIDPPQNFRLDGNYPDPFAAATTIRYAVPTPQHVRIVVYDVLGRTVGILADRVHNAGHFSVLFDAAGLPSGTYFYRLEAEGTRFTESMLVRR